MILLLDDLGWDSFHVCEISGLVASLGPISLHQVFESGAEGACQHEVLSFGVVHHAIVRNFFLLLFPNIWFGCNRARVFFRRQYKLLSFAHLFYMLHIKISDLPLDGHSSKKLQSVVLYFLPSLPIWRIFLTHISHESIITWSLWVASLTEESLAWSGNSFIFMLG